MDCPAHVPEWNEAKARRARGGLDRSWSVGGDGHVETTGERGQEERDVGLGAADLGEGDENQEPGPLGHACRSQA
jgi:hypothetical protein